MVDPGNHLASWVTGLFVMRLGTVRFPTSSSVAFDKPHWQNFQSQVCHWRSNYSILTLATVIACTMFLWDYILTFEMEVDFVWKSKWNFMKCLYLFQRYLPFVEIIWVLFSLVSLMWLPDVVYLSSFSTLNCLYIYIKGRTQMWEDTVCRRVHYGNAGS
jgi:hypothetical protein